MLLFLNSVEYCSLRSIITPVYVQVKQIKQFDYVLAQLRTSNKKNKQICS